jgi:murein DD-endopeptidase MepM/ murein hydrolase activator NlpD
MRKLNRAWWVVLTLALIVVFLQGCRQNEGQAASTAVSTVALNPTAVNASIAVVPPSTPLPIPATSIPTATSTALPPSPTPTSQDTGQWQFPAGTFIHPLALEIIGPHIYILDSGRVQRLDQQTAAMPQVILAPGDEVAGVRVIEPLDLATDGQILLALDRAGDVYAFDPQKESWSLRRYDRSAGETSSHYYLALAAQPGVTEQYYLLEGSYHFALNQRPDTPDFIWPLPEDHQIDITVNQNDVYVLSQSPISQTASLVHYRDGTRDNDFSLQVAFRRARQVQAVGSLVYVLDYGGRRLAAVDAGTGALYTTYLPTDGTSWSAFLVDEINGRILLAGRDRLYFFGAPENQAVIQGTAPHSLPQLHDPQVLESLRGLLMPIGGSDIAVRENQMPGAPRHYRLGIHEGADFYWQSGTAVRAVAPGTVIRATVDYKIPTQEIFAGWTAAVYALGYTSAEAHDFYRGMQVWIQHEDGLISRYVHLSAIDTMIQEGVTVQAGQIIGAVGNTGSPVSLEGPDTDAHLHFELWLNDHYLGQYLRPIETREWLAIILNEQ